MDNGGAMPPNNPAPQPNNTGLSPLPDFMTQQNNPAPKPFSSSDGLSGDGKFKTIIIISLAVILISIAILILVLSGGNKNNGQGQSQGQSGQSGGNSGNNNTPVDEAELEQIARSYAENLIEGNYSSNYRLLALPENSAVSIKDYTDYISKKDAYKSINKTMKVGDVKKVESGGESAKDSFSFTVNLIGSNDDNSTSITLTLAKVGDSWGIQEEHLYISNWSIIIPSGTELYIDGTKMPDSLIKKDEDVFEYSDKYVIPAIYQSKKNFRIVHALATKSFALTPSENESGKEYYLELKNEQLIEKSYEYIKNTWNALYEAYANGNDASSVAKYFDSSLSTDDINNYYKKGFDSLSQGNSNSKNTNFQMTDIVASEKECYVLSKDVITINFGYTLSWNNDKQSKLQTMSRYSKLRLSYDGNEFKIIEAPDDRIFSYSSDGVKEF